MPLLEYLSDFFLIMGTIAWWEILKRYWYRWRSFEKEKKKERLIDFHYFEVCDNAITVKLNLDGKKVIFYSGLPIARLLP